MRVRICGKHGWAITKQPCFTLLYRDAEQRSRPRILRPQDLEKLALECQAIPTIQIDNNDHGPAGKAFAVSANQAWELGKQLPFRWILPWAQILGNVAKAFVRNGSPRVIIAREDFREQDIQRGPTRRVLDKYLEVHGRLARVQVIAVPQTTQTESLFNQLADDWIIAGTSNR